jgi:3-oxoacyl-[acyl-carrier-protein] synthase-1
MEREPGAVRLLGIGEASDAYHATAPDPDGAGAREAMSQALQDAGLTAGDIAYINLHGTGTVLNDAMESKAVAAVFGSAVPCSSSKGMTGHMLGAAGGCEAAFLWLALDPEYNPTALLPPHVWDGARDPALPYLNLIPVGSRISAVHGRRAMLSNSFGFGGSNASLILAQEF